MFSWSRYGLTQRVFTKKIRTQQRYTEDSIYGTRKIQNDLWNLH